MVLGCHHVYSVSGLGCGPGARLLCVRELGKLVPLQDKRKRQTLAFPLWMGDSLRIPCIPASLDAQWVLVAKW